MSPDTLTQARKSNLIARMSKAGVLKDPGLTSTWLRDRILDRATRRAFLYELHPTLRVTRSPKQ